MFNIRELIRKNLVTISVITILLGLLLSTVIGHFSVFVDLLGVIGLVYGLYKERKEKKERKKIDNRILNALQRLDKTEELERVIRRLRGSMKELGISKETLIEEYDNPIHALMIFKFRERKTRRRSTVFRDRLSELGFRYIQNGVWILPPVKTPNLTNAKEIKKWVHSRIIQHISNDLEYVIPFATIIDLRKMFCEKRIPPGAWGRTVFDILGPEDIFKPSFIMKHFAKRSVTIEEMVKLADIIFLGSRVLTNHDIVKIENKRGTIKKRIKKLFGKSPPSLSDYANIDSKSLALVLDEIVGNPTNVAKQIVEEAKFWEEFFEKYSS